MPLPMDIGTHKGHMMQVHGTSYNCPSLALYGKRTDTALKRAINAKLVEMEKAAEKAAKLAKRNK